MTYRCELDLENGEVCQKQLIKVRDELVCPNENGHSLNHFLPYLSICEILDLNPYTAKPYTYK